VKVLIPTPLRSYTRAREVEASGATMGELLADLERQFPGFRFRVIDEQDRVRRHVIIFVGAEREENLAAAIPSGADVQIVGALSGG